MKRPDLGQVIRDLARGVATHGVARESLYAGQERTDETWTSRRPFRPAGGVDLAETVALAEQEAARRRAAAGGRDGEVYFEFNDVTLRYDPEAQRYSSVEARPDPFAEPEFLERAANDTHEALQRERRR